MEFPQDETGSILAEMYAAGIDLSIEQTVEYFQLFEQESDARAMAEHLSTLPEIVEVKVHPDQTPKVWDVDCLIKLVPSYDNICAWEQTLEKLADQFNGYNDGWGIEA